MVQLYIYATFEAKLIINNFEKSHNLVTLVAVVEATAISKTDFIARISNKNKTVFVFRSSEHLNSEREKFFVLAGSCGVPSSTNQKFRKVY